MTKQNIVGFKCLVVDDEEDMAEFVSDVMENLGWDTRICTVPEDFGKHYSASLDVILLDLFMPGVDGIEILRFLHQCNANQSVILLSGKDRSVLRTAKELADEWSLPILGTLQKPFMVAELEALIANFTRKERKRADLGGKNPDCQEIKEAITAGDFSVVYQPQLSLPDGKLVGAEALIRWNHATRGFVSPAMFIPIAEKCGLMEKINMFVAETAIKQLGAWTRLGGKFSVSINMSPASIADLDMPEKLYSLAASNEVAPSQIVIEVTETAVMSNVGDYMDILTRLRMRGFGLAIDDFGTGYSSLHQLVRLPFNELKVDQVFVSKMADDDELQMVVEMATMLGHKLGMHILAEGVEDELAAIALNKIGCDLVQGYHFAKPMPPEMFTGWMRERVAHEPTQHAEEASS